MMSATKVLSVLIVFCSLLVLFVSTADLDVDEMDQGPNVDAQKVEYAKGSVCGYCDYCKFCKLCDDDCPCEPSPNKPNCHMCKYCKYCYLCSGLCDTICQPGGMLDKVSAALVNALPNYNKQEVENDLESVKNWIGKKKDEL